MLDELVRDAPDRRGRNVADRRGPFGRVRRHVRRELRERRLASDAAVGQHVAVGTDLDRVHIEASGERFDGVRRIKRRSARLRRIEHQRLVRRAIAQVVAVRAHEIRRRRVLAQELGVEPLADFMQQHVDQRIQERRVGLGPNGHPFGRTGARHRQMRLDLHAFHAAHARLRMAPDADDAARRFDVRAA